VDLLRKETIDLCLKSMEGAVLTVDHPSVDVIKSRNFADVSHGVVDKVSYDVDSGWYVCEGTVETDAARNRIAEGDGVSCGFSVVERANGGMWHNIPYTQEDTRIEFHHLAIVPPHKKPRFEDADIRLNAKKPMNIAKWIKTKLVGETKTEEAHELPLDTKIDLGEGKSATIQEMIDSERINAVHQIGEDDYIEHEGVKYHAKTLIDHFKANAVRVNDEAETPEAKKAREEKERANAVEAPEAKLLREKAEAQKAIDERIAQEKKDEAARLERENTQKRGAEAFKTLHGAAAKGSAREAPDYSPGVSGSLEDGVNLGRERYGKPVGSRNISGRN
jgi:hypothetical protein